MSLQVKYTKSQKIRSTKSNYNKRGLISNKILYIHILKIYLYLNTFTAIVELSRFNNSCLKSPASTLVDLTFQSRTLRSFSLNQLRNLSL